MQGADKGRCNVDDPSYVDLIEQVVSGERIDFIFEETSGLGPTAAERLAQSIWGQNHYLDVDPPRGERQKHGISADTGEFYPIDPCDPEKSKDVAQWENVEEHIKREELWLQRIKDTAFAKALMICGSAHILSFAYRLRSAEFDVKALYYMPHHKLS